MAGRLDTIEDAPLPVLCLDAGDLAALVAELRWIDDAVAAVLRDDAIRDDGNRWIDQQTLSDVRAAAAGLVAALQGERPPLAARTLSE
jgi:hypothetical protein